MHHRCQLLWEHAGSAAKPPAHRWLTGLQCWWRWRSGSRRRSSAPSGGPAGTTGPCCRGSIGPCCHRRRTRCLRPSSSLLAISPGQAKAEVNREAHPHPCTWKAARHESVTSMPLILRQPAQPILSRHFWSAEPAASTTALAVQSQGLKHGQQAAKHLPQVAGVCLWPRQTQSPLMGLHQQHPGPVHLTARGGPAQRPHTPWAARCCSRWTWPVLPAVQGVAAVSWLLCG